MAGKKITELSSGAPVGTDPVPFVSISTGETLKATAQGIADLATGEVNPDLIPKTEAEAGVATTERVVSAERLKEAIVALTPIVTLQEAYDDSTSPEILTDATRGGLSVKRGSAADTDIVLEVLNGAGVVAFTVDGNGKVTLDPAAWGGVAPNANAEDLAILHDAAVAGLTLGTSTSGQASIFFGDTVSLIQGRIVYNNGNSKMSFFTSAAEQMSIDANQTILNNKLLAYAPTTVLTTVAETLLLAYDGETVELTNALGIALTVDTNANQAFPANAIVVIHQTGAGQVTVTAAGGVTILSDGSLVDLKGQYAAAYLRRDETAPDTWHLVGNLA